MIFWPPHLFIPDRTRCFQQPQIFPPWRQWKEAGAKSIVLLWQRIPHFPGDDVASATSGGRCRRIKCTQSSCPLQGRTALASGGSGAQRFRGWHMEEPALTAGSGPGDGDTGVRSSRY